MQSATECIATEADARRVVLLRAFETGTAEPHRWSDDDRAWASRVARDEAAPSAAGFVTARARAGAERLRQRLPEAAAWLDRRMPFARWAGAAAAVGFVAGAAVDQIGPSQRVELLASPIWLLVGWNLAVYLWLAAHAIARRAVAEDGAWRGWLRRSFTPALPGAGALQRAALDWAVRAAARDLARIAALVHLAAATLGAGVVAALYARGLVLDYRVGWQSTFLDAATVHAVLATLLAPASALTGIALPDVDALEALRITAEGRPRGPAAAWLHLLAATLAWVVIVPRLGLAGFAALRAARLDRCWPLPWNEPYFAALRSEAVRDKPPTLWLVAADAAVAAGTALAVQTLAGSRWACSTAGGDGAAPPAPPTGTAAVLLLADLAGTPEDEVQGRWLGALRAAIPPLRVLLLADQARFAAHAGRWPGRLAERRRAWADFASQQGVELLVFDSTRPDDAEASAALRRALQG